MLDTHSLNGKKVAFLLTNGYEDSELTSPWRAVVDAGAQATLVSPTVGTVRGEKGHAQTVDVDVRQAPPDEFDALVLPGGVVNADHLRTDPRAVAFARGFFEQHKTVGAWCELREDYRHFRIDRIASLAATGERMPRRRHTLLKEWREIMSDPARYAPAPLPKTDSAES